MPTLTQERNQSKEYGVVTQPSSAAEQGVSAAQAYATNRDVQLEAGYKSVASANEKHVAGGKGDSNTLGDDVKDKAAEGKIGMEGYEAAVVAKQGLEALDLNHTMGHDAFAAANATTPAATQDRSSAPEGGKGLTEVTKGLDEATRESAEKGILASAKGQPQQERVPGGLDKGTEKSFADIMRNSGLDKSFASIANGGAEGGKSMFGDGKGMLTAPATPTPDNAARKVTALQ